MRSITLTANDPFGAPMIFEPDEDASNNAASTLFAGSFIVRVHTETPWRHPFGGYVLGFSPVCTHMGCLLVRGADDHNVGYQTGPAEQLTCGPCPCHGTTFDLLKKGLVVLGPATQNLAQLKLKFAEEDKHQILPDGWLQNDKQHVDPREEDWPFTNSSAGATIDE